jgi:hypothetical protein
MLRISIISILIGKISALFFLVILNQNLPTALASGHKYETSIGSSANLHCNTMNHSVQTIGWYFVKKSSIPTLIWSNQNWGNVTTSHYSVLSDNVSSNLTIFNVTDFSIAYFCYDTSTHSYLALIELVDSNNSKFFELF